MSEDSPGQKVLDEEGTVDQKVKQRILQARQRVDDREDYLYIEAPVEDGKSISDLQQVIYWGVAVKQYLRAIEPLLRSDDVSKANEYYKEKSLGSVKLTPKDTDRYPFSKVVSGEIDPMQFKIQHGLERGVSLPYPVTKFFVGLEDIIEAGQTVSKTWQVKTGAFSDPQANGVVVTKDERPIPKPIYESAVREADAFLQQAELGVNVGAPEVNSHPDPI